MDPVTGFDWSAVDLGGIWTEFLKVVPLAIPVVLGFIGFRKGYGWLKSQLKGA